VKQVGKAVGNGAMDAGKTGIKAAKLAKDISIDVATGGMMKDKREL